MATISSNGTGGGDSNAGASWSGGVVPVEGDKVNIVSGDTITMVATHVWGDDSTTAVNIKSGGILKASRSSNSSLTVKGQLVLETGGGSTGGAKLDYGNVTGADEIPTGVYATILLNYSATMATGKYGFLKDTAESYLWLGGATRTVNTTLNGAISAGATSATVDDATGWEVGDTVVFASTSSTTNAQDVITLDTVNTGTGAITWTGGTTNAHADGCYTGNFSSNVTIKAYNTSYPAGGVQMEGNTGTGNDDRIDIQYASFQYLKALSPGEAGLCFYFKPTTGDYYARALANCSFYMGDTSPLLSFSRYADPNLTVTNCAFYNSAGTYLTQCGVQGASMSFDSCVWYGKVTTTFLSNNGVGGVGNTFTDCVFSGATTGHFDNNPGLDFRFTGCRFLSAPYACDTKQGGEHIYDTCYFGVGPGTPTMTNGIKPGFGGANTLVTHRLIDADTSGVTSDFISASIANCHPNFKVIFANKDSDPTDQQIITPAGTFSRDDTTYRTSAPALKAAPVSATKPMTIEFNIIAPNDTPVVVTGFFRKDSSYGSSNRPTAKLSGLGITASTYTMTDVDDTWEQFTVSGRQATGAAGVLTLTLTFQAAAGTAWVDDVSAPAAVAVNTGEFNYWAEGQPAKLIAANFVAPIDVWNVQTSALVTSGSVGAKTLTDLTTSKFLALK